MDSRFFERQHGESTPAWEAFKAYRDLGPTRSIDKAYRAHTGEQQGSNKRASGRWTDWARRFDWVDRAQAYDDWLEMTRRSAVEEHERTVGADVARRRDALAMRQLDLAEKLADQMAEMIRWPLQERESVSYDEDGRPVAVTIRPAKWTKNTLKRYHDMISLVSGGVTERIEATVDHSGEMTLDISALTDEEQEVFQELLDRVVADNPS